MGYTEEKREEQKDRLFNFRPAFFSAVFLIFGIVFAYHKLLQGISAWWLLSLLPVAAMPFFFCRGKEEFFCRALAILLLAASFLFGFISFRYQIYAYTDCGYYNGDCTVTGTVVSRADFGDAARLVLDDIYIDGKSEKGLLNAYLPPSFCNTVHIADVVVLEGYVQMDTELFNSYGFRANAVSDGVRFTLNYADGYAVAGRSENIFLLVRDRVERTVRTGMDESAAAVTLAVLLGDTSLIESDLLDNMRQGGIAHIFAVSGLHVGALYAFCLFAFSRGRLKRTPKAVRFLLLSFVLLFYAGVCGFSASIIRAATLCIFGYFMKLLGSKSDSLNVLGFGAILILFFSPSAIFEIGFQLSFMASIGIVLLSKRIGQVCDECYKRFRNRFPRALSEEERETLERGDTLPLSVGERIFRAVVSVFSASLAAQIATAPLMYLAFGYLSGWSLLLNLFFVPLVSGVFAALLLFVATASILPLAFSPYILYVPSVLWNLALLVFEAVDFSTFALTGMQLSGANCVCYYGGMSFLSDKWNISKRQRYTLAAVCFIGFALILALLNL